METMDSYQLFVEIVGWIGMILILGAYGLITTNRVKSDTFSYQLMNALGSIGLIINALYNEAYPLFVLNVIWEMIALFGLYQSIKKSSETA
jgi:hypothetical protein